jgi:hypothetical protein
MPVAYLIRVKSKFIEYAKSASGESIAATLVARERCFVDDRNLISVVAQRDGRGTSSGSSTHNNHMFRHGVSG